MELKRRYTKRFWLTKHDVKTGEIVEDYGLCEMHTINIITRGYKKDGGYDYDGYNDNKFTRKNSKFFYRIEF